MESILQKFNITLLEQGLSPTTIHGYKVALKSFFVYARSTDIDDATVEAFFLQKLQTISPAGVNKYIKSFRKYYDFVGKPHPKFFKTLREKRKERILLSDKEIEAVVNVSPPPDKWGMFFYLLSYTGMRPKEAAVLSILDFDPAQKCIYVHQSKTGKARTIPVVEPLFSTFNDYTKSCTTHFLFPVDRDLSRHIEAADWAKEWKKRLKVLGIKKGAKPYSLRHSYLTNTLGNGANLYDIQDIVGHTSAETTRQYYHGNLALMRKAASRLPLAQKHQNPKELVDQLSGLIDEFLAKDPRYDTEEILESKKHLYRSIKKKD